MQVGLGGGGLDSTPAPPFLNCVTLGRILRLSNAWCHLPHESVSQDCCHHTALSQWQAESGPHGVCGQDGDGGDEGRGRDAHT